MLIVLSTNRNNIMTKQRYIYACVKFYNPACGTKRPEDRFHHLETQIFKGWRAVNAMLCEFLDEPNSKDVGDQYIERTKKAVQIVRTTR
jgi:hypothetical protein